MTDLSILGDTIDPATKAAISTCLNVFSGEDGGVGFIKLTNLIRRFDKEAKDGNEASMEIIKVVQRFGRLCDYAKNS